MRTSAKRAELSPLIGKTVEIRHATETDLAFIEERLKKHGLDTDDLQASQFVVAVENNSLIGFGRLRKTGDAFDIGCVAVVEERRNRGIGTAIIDHMMEYSGPGKVYVTTGFANYFRKRGFTTVRRLAGESRSVLDIDCGAKERGASVLMVYEKK